MMKVVMKKKSLQAQYSDGREEREQGLKCRAGHFAGRGRKSKEKIFEEQISQHLGCPMSNVHVHDKKHVLE